MFFVFVWHASRIADEIRVQHDVEHAATHEREVVVAEVLAPTLDRHRRWSITNIIYTNVFEYIYVSNLISKQNKTNKKKKATKNCGLRFPQTQTIGIFSSMALKTAFRSDT